MAKLMSLRAHRERRALTQRELATLAGTAQMTITRLEGGHAARPMTIRKLARALKVRPGDLLDPIPDWAEAGR